MKRFITFVSLFVLACAVLSACGGASKKTATTTTTSVLSSTSSSVSILPLSTTTTARSSGATTTSATIQAKGTCGDVQLGSSGSSDTIRITGGVSCDTAKALAGNSAVTSSQTSFDASGFHCVSTSASGDPDQLYQCTSGSQQVTFDAHVNG